jgi:uncharacterized cupredoxin-like copper-binding protein
MASAPAEATTGAQGEASMASTVAVGLSSFAIDMPATLPSGMTVFEVTNSADIEHNLEIERDPVEIDLGENLASGETRSLAFHLEPGTYEVYCPVDGHREQGMSLELTVTE